MQDIRVQLQAQGPAYKLIESTAVTSSDLAGTIQLSDASSKLFRQRAQRVGASLGIARKLALLTILLSVVGWVSFVLGFTIYRNQYLYDGSVAEYPELCWAWTGTIVGPFAYVMAAVHALCWRRSNAALGSVLSLLGFIYTVTLGYAAIVCLIFTYEVTQDSRNTYFHSGSYPECIGLMLAGSSTAIIFWALTQALWPWYTPRPDSHSHTPPSCYINSGHLPLISKGETESL